MGKWDSEVFPKTEEYHKTWSYSKTIPVASIYIVILITEDDFFIGKNREEFREESVELM